MAIARVILSHEDTAAMGMMERAQAAHALAINMGGVMAHTLIHGEDAYKDALLAVMEVVDRQARATHRKGLEFSNDESLGRTH